MHSGCATIQHDDPVPAAGADLRRLLFLRSSGRSSRSAQGAQEDAGARAARRPRRHRRRHHRHGRQGRRRRRGAGRDRREACGSASCAARSPRVLAQDRAGRRRSDKDDGADDDAPTCRQGKRKTPTAAAPRQYARRAKPGTARVTLSMLYFRDWKIVAHLGICALGVLFALPNLLSRRRRSTACRAGCRRSRSASASICAAARICCSKSTCARCRAASGSTRSSTTLRTQLAPAKIGYTGLNVEGDHVTLHAARHRPARTMSARIVNKIDPELDPNRATIGTGAGDADATTTVALQARQQLGGRPVDRDHPPPHRRDRHQGADDPARGRRTASWSSCPASTIPSTSRTSSARPRR